MKTDDLFRRDAFAREVDAEVIGHIDGGFITDITVFYAQGGGQPGDTGTAELAHGGSLTIANTVKAEGECIAHLVGEGSDLPPVGSKLTLKLDWARRHRLMRMHTTLHLLCSLVDAPVTGGSIGEAKSRLDFDLEETPDKVALTERLNALIQADHAITLSEITDADLDANPDLVRTMSVQPPRNAEGVIRMVRIGEGETSVDYQPCGGTHVASTAEIGAVEVAKIEKKGRQNRRVSVVLTD